jgi:RNA polymerase sigma factor (sigma-70 family)
MLLSRLIVIGQRGAVRRVSKMDTLQIFLAAQAELLRYATRITGDSTEAEDVMQEAWLRFRAIAGARPLEEPHGYLVRIVRNLALDRQRKQGRENRLFVPDTTAAVGYVPSEEPSQQAGLEGRDELARLRKTMARLPERTRRAFEMHRFEDMKLIEIAEELGISKSVASELVIEAVEFCKKALRRAH